MSNQFLFGINAVESRLNQGVIGIEKLLVREGQVSSRLQQLLDLGNDLGCLIERVKDKRLSALTSVTHQGVGLEHTAPKISDEEDLYALLDRSSTDLLLLVLDGVTDPRNLGACMRSAATLGVQAVVVPKDNSAPLNDAAIKTASGGASYIPLIQVTNLARTLSKLQAQGVWLVGTLLAAEQAISDVDLTGNIALVMGSEQKGLRQKTAKCCDFLVNIPMLNDTFGFNVSVATGICLYEANRQRSSSK
ncbi:MAG: 23S rRNA (guanosine(2251)-2'-O)-methyltransferase RlmB [Pseudomonadales bacterium]|nr:23S rRNA (guanosine(2251)-2'-O)-methyltransferase RlmB [Pseudomonadales bacterium]